MYGERSMHYSNIEYGTNTKTIKRIKKKKGYTEHLPKIVSWYIIIVFLKSCYEDEANISIYNTASEINCVPSVMILTCMCINKTTASVPWGMNQYNIIKTSKKSVITKTSNHKNSTGLYYAYGNKGNFGLINDSITSQYTYQKYKSKFKTKLSQSNNNFI